MATMTRGDREELRKTLNGRRRVARADVDARKAQLTADLEAQLARIYPIDDPRWKDIAAAAQAAVRQADEKVAKICRESGIPEEFRPELHCSWYGRGENGAKDRRTELRKVGVTEIDARAKQALLAIDKDIQRAVELLSVDALETDAAQAFLAEMPSVETLMPVIEVDALKLADGSRRPY